MSPFSSERSDFSQRDWTTVLGDADLTPPCPDDAAADPTPLAILERLIRAEEIELPPEADRVLRPLRDTLGEAGDDDTLRQAVEALAWGLRSYAAAREEVHQLREALTSRSTIDEAKGILMAEHQVDPDVAFQMLVRLSNDTNVRLVDVARAMVYQVQNGNAPEPGDPAVD